MTLDAGASGALLGSPAPTEDGLRERYIARLLQTFPAELSICYLTHSRNEATELALRLARAHRPGKDVIVHEDSVYGTTTSLANMSPGRRKFWVHAVGRKDAGEVRERAQEISDGGRGLCGFFAEGVFQDGYLSDAYASVREAGGLTVAIEEQTGMGRIGPAFWEFARQGAIPDVVVVGESLGGGYPMAAVVTRPEFAAPFDPGPGGGAAACRAGLATLESVRPPAWSPDFSDFAARGAGLCWEIEVADASAVAERLRERGIGIGVRGNTLLFRPPLSFSPQDAERVVAALRACTAAVQA